MPAVYSTLTNDNVYPVYVKSGDNKNIIIRQILVKGGANRVSKINSSGGVLTPRGVATLVSDDQLQALKQSSAFNLHLKNGFLSIDEKSNKTPKAWDLDDKNHKAIKDLKSEDNSSPLTTEKFTKQGLNPPVVEKK